MSKGNVIFLKSSWNVCDVLSARDKVQQHPSQTSWVVCLFSDWWYCYVPSYKIKFMPKFGAIIIKALNMKEQMVLILPAQTITANWSYRTPNHTPRNILSLQFYWSLHFWKDQIVFFFNSIPAETCTPNNLSYVYTAKHVGCWNYRMELESYRFWPCYHTKTENRCSSKWEKCFLFLLYVPFKIKSQWVYNPTQNHLNYNTYVFCCIYISTDLSAQPQIRKAWMMWEYK